MKKENNDGHYRLTGQLFLCLLGVAFASVILFGAFWVERQLSNYHKEVKLLKASLYETKKLEIKNKILQIKDYIEWIKNSPVGPVSQTLTYQTKQLHLSAETRVISGNYPEILTPGIKDSISKSLIPIYILNKAGEILYSFNPFLKTKNISPAKHETALLHKFLNRNVGKGTELFYKSDTPNGSTLEAIGYSDNEILPGFKVVSVVNSENFRDILRVFILDTISNLRYSENEYVFVNSFSGKALISNGHYNRYPVDIFKSGNTSWINIFKVQQSAESHPDGVFYDYTWQKLSTSDSSIKTSYFSYIPDWKWIIGTGFYAEDINSVIDFKRRALYDDLRGDMLSIIAYLLISSLICYLLVRFFSGQISRNIELFKNFFEKAATENLLIDKSLVNYKEFVFMADAANQMVEKKKMTEKALKNSEAQYRYLFEQNPAPILIYELGSLKILMVNEAFSNHYGYSMDDIKTMLLSDLYPEDEKKAISDLSKKLTGHAYAGEWHHLKKDGTRITIEAYSHGFFYDGHDSRIAVISDITDRKLAEEQILNLNVTLEKKVDERTAQLAKINKELESFSYSISHDLRAPLRAIYGFSQIISTRHRASLNTEGQQYCDYIVQASIRMEQLINDLLTYSRLGRKSIDLHKVSLHAMVDSVYSDFKQQLTDADAKLIVNQELPQIIGDESLLSQIFTNLVSNAIVYRKTDVSLIIEISYEKVANDFIIKIVDNGIGIAEEYWEKIFDVFQRLHSEDEYPGTGIGLASVRKAVTMLGGTIWVNSVVGEGSIFFIKFPENKLN